MGAIFTPRQLEQRAQELEARAEELGKSRGSSVLLHIAKVIRDNIKDEETYEKSQYSKGKDE